jgi:hypothetical protein
MENTSTETSLKYLNIVRLLRNSDSLDRLAISSNDSENGGVVKAVDLVQSCQVTVVSCMLTQCNMYDILYLLTKLSPYFIQCNRLASSSSSMREFPIVDLETANLQTFLLLDNISSSPCTELLNVLSGMRNLQHLELTKTVTSENSQSIEAILVHCGNLDNLVIGTSFNHVHDPTEVPSHFHEDIRMRNIIKKCSKLRRLSRLSISTLYFSENMAKTIAVLLPQLYYFLWYSNLYQEGAIELLFVNLCPNLESITLVNRNTYRKQPGFNETTMHERGKLQLEVVSNACPNLISFIAPDILIQTPDWRIGNTFGTLRSLSTRLSSEVLADGCLVEIVSSCRHLECLKIFGEDIYATNFLQILQHGSCLETLEIGFDNFEHDDSTYDQFVASANSLDSRVLNKLYLMHLEGITPIFVSSFCSSYESIN